MYDESQAEFPEASCPGAGWALGEVQSRGSAGAGHQRVSQTPTLSLRKLMGPVGRCGSVAHASFQGEGSRKLSLSI